MMVHAVDLRWNRDFARPLAVLASVLAAACGAVPEGDLIGGLDSYRTRQDDTLIALARDFGVGYTELVAANPGIDPWLPGEGTELTVPHAHILPSAPREGVVINLAEQRLDQYRESLERAA